MLSTKTEHYNLYESRIYCTSVLNCISFVFLINLQLTKLPFIIFVILLFPEFKTFITLCAVHAISHEIHLIMYLDKMCFSFVNKMKTFTPSPCRRGELTRILSHYLIFLIVVELRHTPKPSWKLKCYFKRLQIRYEIDINPLTITSLWEYI